MLILALDTTTRGGSVAVTNDDHLLALVPGDETRTHAERLPGEIGAALHQAGVLRRSLDLLAVATGPGAFTGLRIGLAAIQGLAMALDRPVAGISALDALAWQIAGEPVEFIAPWMDAQRGEVFGALYSSGLVIEPPIAASPETLLTEWRQRIAGHSVTFIGDAVNRDAEAIAQFGDGRWTTRVPGPLAPAIAILARQRSLAGLAGPPHTLEPIYVRRSDAEIERERQGKPSASAPGASAARNAVPPPSKRP